MQRKLENALDECLARIKEGESLEDCLRRYPQYRDELRSLLCTDLLVRQAFEQSVERHASSEDALARIRERFMAEVDRRDSHENPRPDSAVWQRYFGWFSQPFRSKALQTVVVVFLLLMGILGGGIMVSANSLPGDTLYGVKRASERMCLFLTFDEEAQADLEQRYRERRGEEIKKIVAQGRTVNVTFEGAVESVQDDTVVVSGIPMALNPEADTFSPSVGTKVQVLAETQGDGTVRAKALGLWEQKPLVASTEFQGEDPTSPPSHTTSDATPTWTPEPSPTNTARPTPTDLPTETAEMVATAVVDATATETMYIVPSFTPIPSPTGTPLPTETVTPEPSPRDIRLCIEGVIEEIGDDHWTVAGTRFELGGTMLMDEEQARAQVGGWATVDVVKKPDGRLIARSITVLRGPEQPSQPREIEGVIESMEEKVWIIEGCRVLVEPDTVIEGTPEVGTTVYVKAEEYPDGRLVAKGVTVEYEPEDVVQFEGAIRAMEGDRWTVGEQEVIIDDETHVDREPAVGDTAEVDAVVREDGSQVARSIRIKVTASPEPSTTPTDTRTPTKPAEAPTSTSEAEGSREGMSEKGEPE